MATSSTFQRAGTLHAGVERERSTRAEFSKDDVQLLPRYSAIIATEVVQERQPAFTVQVTNFEEQHLG